MIRAQRIIDSVVLLASRLAITPHNANQTAIRVTPHQSDQQMGIPEDQRQAMAKVDAMLINAGVTTPKELAILLDGLRPDGSLRKYSQALWNCLSMARPALSGAHDWTAIYRGESELEGAKTSPAEMIRQLEAEIERVKAEAQAREAAILQQAEDRRRNILTQASSMTEELRTELGRIRHGTSLEIKALQGQIQNLQAQKDSLQILADECAPIKSQLNESQVEKDHLRVLAENAKHHLGSVEHRMDQVQRATLNVMIVIHIGLSLAWPWVFIKKDSLWSSTLEATSMERWIWCVASLAGWGITELSLLFLVINESVANHGGLFMACLSWMALGFIYMTGRKEKNKPHGPV